MTARAEQTDERDTATDRLLSAYRERRDLRAHKRLVQLYLPLVDTFARRYERPGTGYEDLLHAGSIGLVDAIEHHVPRRGEFIAFAVPLIVGEIKACVRQALATATPSPSTETPRPEDVPPDFDLRDDRVELAAAYRSLDETEHAIVRLRFVEDLGAEQAARRLGMSESQLSRRMHGALVKIRGELERRASSADDTSSSRPSDQATDPHGGRLLLRMPQSLHSELVTAAEREEVSLNQLITNTLAAARGWHADDRAEERPARDPAPAPSWLRTALVANLVLLALAGVLGIALVVVGWQGW